MAMKKSLFLFIVGWALPICLVSASEVTVNQDDHAILRLKDYVGDVQWQKSTDGSTWQPIDGATADTLLFVADVTTWFRAEVTAGWCDPFISETVLVTVIPDGGIGSCPTCPGSPTVADAEGNTYPTVMIGEQCWMAENLKTTKYRNGDAIARPATETTWRAATSGAYAVYRDNDVRKDQYGLLYNWYAVDDDRGLCPTGWRVPTHDEWTDLERVICTSETCASDFPYDNSTFSWGGTNEGNKLKSCRQTNSPLGGECATSQHPYWVQHATQYGTDEFCFGGLPGGARSDPGFFGLLDTAHWWSSSSFSDEHAWGRYLYESNGGVGRYWFVKHDGMSVRCIKE
jgi:uncharacterized protein (TIGR02145 family)